MLVVEDGEPVSHGAVVPRVLVAAGREWRTAGRQDRTTALARCVGPTVQGGRAVLAQWYDLEADHDTLCPGRPPRQVLAKYFSPH